MARLIDYKVAKKLGKENEIRKERIPVLESGANNATSSIFDNPIPVLGDIILPKMNGVSKVNDDNVISKYESIPDYNILERTFDSQKRDAYNAKSAMQDEYKQAKNRKMSDFMTANGITDDMYNLNKISEFKSKYNDIIESGKKNGISEEDIKSYISDRQAKALNDKATSFAENHPILGTALSIPLSLGNIATVQEEAKNYITGKPIGSNETANLLGGISGDIRENVTNQIRENAKTDFGKEAGSLLYGVGTSIGDQLLNMAIGGPGASLALMGAEATGASLNEQKEKNTTDSQKIASALTSGAIEMLTEKLPLDNLFAFAKGNVGKKTAKRIIRDVLKQTATEAGEESISEIANTVADNIINNEQSNYNQSVLNYINSGLDEDTAKANATKDVVSNVLMSALAGGISGGVMGAGANIIGNIANNNNITEETKNVTETPQQETKNILDGVKSIEETANTPAEMPQNDVENNNVVNPVPILQNTENKPNKRPIVPTLDNTLQQRSAEAWDDAIQNPEMPDSIIKDKIETNYGANIEKYSPTSIDGFDDLSKNIEKYVNMYGDEDVKSLHAQLNSLVNEYIATYNQDAIDNAIMVADKMDDLMQGKFYKQKTGRKNTLFYPEGALVTELFNNNRALRDAAKTKVDLSGNDNNEIVMKEDIGLNDSKRGRVDVDSNGNPTMTINLAPESNASITSKNTYQNSKVFQKSKESLKWLADERKKGTFDVDSVSENASLDKAAQRLNENKQREIDNIYNDENLDNYQVDESMMLLDEYVDEALKTGDWSKVREFSSMVNQKIHKMAQGLQALAKHSRSAASAIMKTGSIVEQLGGKFNASDADLQEVTRLFNEADKFGEFSKQRADLEQQAYKILAKYLPDTSVMDKWNAWRYLAMLGNPRTHIRNVLGNTMFGAVTNMKDNLAAVIENAFVRNGEKTKSILGVGDTALINASKADADNVWTLLTEGGSKYNLKNAIESERQVYKNKAIEKARVFNNNALETEDNFALVNKYKRALAGYIKANGYNESIFNSQNKSDMDFLDRARKYAIHEAQVATFHEDNNMANILNQFSKSTQNKGPGGKALNFIMESLLPFKKTPLNVLKQGAIEYNPVQIVHGLFDAVRKDGNATKAIDEIAKGLTGSAIMALGYYLAEHGILRGRGKESEEDLDKLTGEQDWSLNFGGKSYTIDWMAPAALPLFVGEAIHRAFDEKDLSVLDAFAAIGDPIVEMSMLQGLKDTIESIASFDRKKTTLGELGVNIGYNYASQGIPTILGQVARSADDTRRTTYTGKTGTEDTIAKNAKKAQNKIPMLSMLNQPYVNQWGEMQENTGGNFLGRLAYNMLSPGYYSDTQKSNVENELYRLNDLMASDKIEKQYIIPSLAEKTYEKQRLTPEEYTEYAQIKGDNVKNIMEKVVNSSKYDKLSDESKAELLHNVMLFSDAISKGDMFDYDVASANNYKKAYSIYQKKSVDGLMNYYAIKAAQEGKSGVADLVKAIESTGVADKGYYFMEIYGQNSMSSKALLLSDINPDYAYDYYKIQSNYGSKKDDMLYGVAVSDLSENEKQALYSVLDMKDADAKYQLAIQGIK